MALGRDDVPGVELRVAPGEAVEWILALGLHVVQGLPTVLEHPADLAQHPIFQVRWDVAEHVQADDQIERAIGEGQGRQVGAHHPVVDLSRLSQGALGHVHPCDRAHGGEEAPAAAAAQVEQDAAPATQAAQKEALLLDQEVAQRPGAAVAALPAALIEGAVGGETSGSFRLAGHLCSRPQGERERGRATRARGSGSPIPLRLAATGYRWLLPAPLCLAIRGAEPGA